MSWDYYLSLLCSLVFMTFVIEILWGPGLILPEFCHFCCPFFRDIFISLFCFGDRDTLFLLNIHSLLDIIVVLMLRYFVLSFSFHVNANREKMNPGSAMLLWGKGVALRVSNVILIYNEPFRSSQSPCYTTKFGDNGWMLAFKLKPLLSTRYVTHPDILEISVKEYTRYFSDFHALSWIKDWSKGY